MWVEVLSGHGAIIMGKTGQKDAETAPPLQHVAHVSDNASGSCLCCGLRWWQQYQNQEQRTQGKYGHNVKNRTKAHAICNDAANDRAKTNAAEQGSIHHAHILAFLADRG